MADCKLSPGTGGCRFTGTPGAVTLSVRGTIGSVLFQLATYKGKAIDGLPSNTLTFTLDAGAANLDVVYSFSDPATGAGVLKESCTNATALAIVSAEEPFQRYRVCGAAS